MTAILGRMATYSGKVINWSEAIESKLALVPTEFGWNISPPVAQRAVPGQTQVV